MAEIEITLPTVEYANVKVRATPEELGLDIASPAAVGTATAIYLNLFTQGFKLGASMDVTASPTEGLSAPVSASQEAPEESLQGAVETAHREAQRLLDEGLGGVTEVSAAEAETTTQSVPWTEKVDAPKKPWETDVTAPAGVSEDW
ncbi:MAG TPA: hypothetical protein VIY48_10780 [Candidatus Paceibacterota bacterium]